MAPTLLGAILPPLNHPRKTRKSRYASVVLLWALSIYWLFFRGGAEALMAHPGLLRSPVGSPRAIKLYFLLALAGGVAGLLMMLFGDLQVPR